ncbi:MAG: glycosyltransferase family 4 protein [Gemmatimonadetes bacterium]|nr:glycosyltransferase family 4 protein [Gemmatimonadota bacterium]
MDRGPRIGYLECAGDGFISNVVLNRSFVDLLGRLTEVVTARTTPGTLAAADIERLRADHVLVDLQNFGFIPFVLREQHALDVRFVVVLHTVHAWAGLLLYTLPLLKPGDVVLAPTESAKRSLLRMSPGADAHVVRYCLDVQAIQRDVAPARRTPAAADIVYLGRLVPPKGLELLLDCVPAIRREVPEVRLHIVGPLSGGSMGDEPVSPFVAGLRSRVEREGLDAHVVFHGARFGVDKYRRLAASRLFVCPTTYTGETAVFSMIEAMACGLPVVATRHAGIEELAVDGEHGRLVDVRFDGRGAAVVERDALVAAVCGMLRDEELADRMGRNAAARAMAHDYRTVLPPLLALLRQRRADPMGFAWDTLRESRPVELDGVFAAEFLSLCRRAGAGCESLGSAYDNLMARLRGGGPPGASARGGDAPTEGEHTGALHTGALHRYLCLP